MAGLSVLGRATTIGQPQQQQAQPRDYASGAAMKTPTGKASIPNGGNDIINRSASLLGPRSGSAGGNSGVSGGGGNGIPSLNDLFSSLGLGGGSGGPGGAGGAGGAGGGGNSGVFGGGPPPSGGGAGGPLGGNPLQISAPENPNLTGMGSKFQNLQDQWSQYGNQLGQYGKDLAASNDLSATQAMQRQRDALSGAAKEFGAGTSARGINGTGAAGQDLVNKIVNPGQQGIAQLNENLANSGRQQQFGVMQQQGNALSGQGSALGGQEGAVNNAANWQQQQQNFGLEQWKAQQNNQLAQWQLQNQQRSQGMNQLLSLLGMF